MLCPKHENNHLEALEEMITAAKEDLYCREYDKLWNLLKQHLIPFILNI